MYHLVNNYTDKSGNALAGYYVKLKVPGGAYATLYGDESGTPIISTSGVADAAVTNANGVFDAYVADGTYDIEFFDKNDVNVRLGSVSAVPMFTNYSPTISPIGYGAVGDGITEDTAAFQAAHDALVDGGVVNVPAGTYLVDQVIVTNQHITFDLAPGAVLKRYGSAGTAKRGLFDIRNLPDANFTLKGGKIDLNGEGCQGVGTAGRIPNNYSSKYVAAFPTIFSIDGPNNSAIYALRSTFIKVIGVEIANTGETGLLFRNCADILVQDSRFSNTANCGVEFTVTDAADDGGTADMPERGRWFVRNCEFEDIDDFGLNTGNGVAVLFGGAGSQGAIPNTEVSKCKFRRCHRDIHCEFSTGTYLDGFLWDAPRSWNARQGSLGLTGARNGVVSNPVLVDSGYAPTGALLAQILGTGTPGNWPSMNVISMSQDVVNVKVTDFQIIDNRNSKIRVGADGAITAGSKIFNSASASFAATDVGTFIGIAGAGTTSGATPTHLVALVVAQNSATQLELDIVAATTVAGAKYAYGGASREPLRANGVDSFEWTNGVVISGTHSGLTGEPDAQAVLVDGINANGRGKIAGLRVVAPTTPGTSPAGVRLASLPSGKLEFEPGSNTVAGFTANYVGVDSHKAGLVNPSTSKLLQNATVSLTINTYGSAVTISPRKNHFEQMTAASVEFDTLNAGGVVSETVTALLTAYRYDGNGPNTVTLTATANSTVILTPSQLATLNEDGAWITSFEIKAKSDKASSTARARLTMIAREG